MRGVLVDTCVWSLALRANRESPITERLSQLIDDAKVRIIGPIKQELLSGYSHKKDYEQLRQRLKYFPNEPISDSDYESAAEYFNVCRSKGVQGSHIDFLICAVAVRANFTIFTTDQDFSHYSKHLPLKLLEN